MVYIKKKKTKKNIPFKIKNFKKNNYKNKSQILIEFLNFKPSTISISL